MQRVPTEYGKQVRRERDAAKRAAKRARVGGQEVAAPAVAKPDPMTMYVADPSKASGKRQVVRPERRAEYNLKALKASKGRTPEQIERNATRSRERGRRLALAKKTTLAPAQGTNLRQPVRGLPTAVATAEHTAREERRDAAVLWVQDGASSRLCVCRLASVRCGCVLAGGHTVGTCCRWRAPGCHRRASESSPAAHALAGRAP